MGGVLPPSFAAASPWRRDGVLSGVNAACVPTGKSIDGTICAVSVLEFVASLVSSVAWPVVALALGLVFRKQITALASQLTKRFERLTKLSGGGFEAQFEDFKEMEFDREFEAARQGTARGSYGWAATATGRADRSVEAKAEAEGEVESAPVPLDVQLDPEVRALLSQAKAIVDREPREAVLIAGRALERSLMSTLRSLKIPYDTGAMGAIKSPIRALGEADVAGDLQVEWLQQLYSLYRSAARDSAGEITGLSAMQYISRVEREVASLAMRSKELSESGTDSSSD